MKKQTGYRATPRREIRAWTAFHSAIVDLGRQTEHGLCAKLGVMPADGSPVACGSRPGHAGPCAWSDMGATPAEDAPRQGTLFGEDGGC